MDKTKQTLQLENATSKDNNTQNRQTDRDRERQTDGRTNRLRDRDRENQTDRQRQK